MDNKKKILIGVVVLILVLTIGGVIYYTIYNNVTDRETFDGKTENLGNTPVDTTSNSFDFYIIKEEHQDDIKFNDYLTFSDRKYYLAGNIKEFYVIDGESMILKSYITNFNHTLDNPSIDKITAELTEKEILKDGGTTIYKSKDKDITIVDCKTIDGNDDIFIGDYSMNFDNESMCK